MDRGQGSQPVGLADVLNPTEEQRDSAYYSSNGDASKHTSTTSCNGAQSYHSPSSSSAYQSPAADKTPSPVAANSGVPPLVSPASTGMSVAALVSPTTPSSMDTNMLRKLDNRASYDAPSVTANGESLSRRESVDSRMNQNFGELRLASSPYASANQSTTSLQSSLLQQRNPAANADRLSTARFSNSYQPNQARFGAEPPKTAISRTAPAITGPTAGAVAHAAEPTKGQAWAFPDDTGGRVTPGGRPNGDGTALPTPFANASHVSLADSVASSQFTSDSRLPPGQRRLDEGLPPDYQRGSSEFHGAAHHHHHTLQHKQVGDLRESDAVSTGSGVNGGAAGGGTYSRTPELRISHKLAERKRRTEMKDLFEQLRDLMPQERGNKASKWEILSRAIAEHHRQDEYIRTLTEACHRAQDELNFARQESNMLRMENRQLRQDLATHSGAGQVMHHVPPHTAAPPANPAPPQPPMEAYASDAYARSLPHRGNEMRTELPPLRAMQTQQPESMTGVQYQHDAPRVNGIVTERF